MTEALELDPLIEELRTALDPEAAHKLERLVHTHVGGPMTTVATQVEILKILADRDPEKLPEEIIALKGHLQLATQNIRTIVRALAAATRPADSDENSEDKSEAED